MPIVYGISGNKNVVQGAIVQNGPPPANLKGELGQTYVDKSTSPRSLYQYNGTAWVQNQLSLSTDATFAAASNDTASSSLAIKTYVDQEVQTVTDQVDSVTQLASVTLSSAEVLALATTPITLVAAPGAGNYIEFLGASLILDYESAGYTESGDNLGIKYTDASGVQVSNTIECTGFIDQTADTITNAIPVLDTIVAATGAVNQPLVLDNLGSNFAAGDSPLIVKVAYRVIASGL
jgi:hypothetical protein